jgi:hypothetical protein
MVACATSSSMYAAASTTLQAVASGAHARNAPSAKALCSCSPSMSSNAWSGLRAYNGSPKKEALASGGKHSRLRVQEMRNTRPVTHAALAGEKQAPAS